LQGQPPSLILQLDILVLTPNKWPQNSQLQEPPPSYGRAVKKRQ
jgi:hypothetical protein